MLLLYGDFPIQGQVFSSLNAAVQGDSVPGNGGHRSKSLLTYAVRRVARTLK